jgi:hypothetical protein
MAQPAKSDMGYLIDMANSGDIDVIFPGSAGLPGSAGAG